MDESKRTAKGQHMGMGGNLTLLNLSDEVKEALHMTGTDKRLNIQ